MIRGYQNSDAESNHVFTSAAGPVALADGLDQGGVQRQREAGNRQRQHCLKVIISSLFTIPVLAAQPVCNITNTQINGYVLTATQTGGHLCAWQAPTGGGSGPTPPPSVASFNGRTGAVVATTGDYTYSMVTGAAPLASPAFTGTPTAPTPGLTDNTTKIATTAFVQALVGTSSCPTCTLGTPTNHGVVLGATGQNLSFSSAGTAGQAFLSGGASADGAYGALNLAGGSGIVTGVLPAANLPTGSAVAKGILQGDGSTITISAGIVACTTATNSQLGCVRPDGTTVTISGGVISAVTSGSGTVSSVGLSLPAIFSVSGSPVTGAGTLTATLATQAANTVWAGATSGGAATPAFRALVLGDIPTITSAKVNNTIALTGGDINTSSQVVATHLSAPLPINQGGTGTTTPGLVAGTGVTITGSWPNQTITSSGGGCVTAGVAGVVAYYPTTSPCPAPSGITTTAASPGTAGYAALSIGTPSGDSMAGLVGWQAPTSGGGFLWTLPGADSVGAFASNGSGTVSLIGFSGTGNIVRASGGTVSGLSCTSGCTGFGGSGGVSSVALSMPGIFSVSGSPITSAGTFTVSLGTQAANTVWAGPTTGPVAAPTFRALVSGDLPTITSANVNTSIAVTGGDISTASQVVATHLSAPLPVVQGGTGTSTPGLVAGAGIAITGSWPNQTVAASGIGTGNVSTSGTLTSQQLILGAGTTNIASAGTTILYNGSSNLQTTVCALPSAGGVVIVNQNITLTASVTACSKTAVHIVKQGGVVISPASTYTVLNATIFGGTGEEVYDSSLSTISCSTCGGPTTSFYNNSMFITAGSSAPPLYQQTDAVVVVGRNSSDSTGTGGAPRNGAARTTLSIETDYSGAIGTAVGIFNIMRITGNTSSNGSAASYNQVYLDSATSTFNVAVHGQCDGQGAGECASFNAEGSHSGTTYGLVVNQGIGASSSDVYRGFLIGLHHPTTNTGYGGRILASQGTHAFGLEIEDDGGAGTFTNNLIVSSHQATASVTDFVTTAPSGAGSHSINWWGGAVNVNRLASITSNPEISGSYAYGSLAIGVNVNFVHTPVALFDSHGLVFQSGILPTSCSGQPTGTVYNTGTSATGGGTALGVCP